MLEELLQIEHELGSSSADAYRQYLAEDAVVIVPGAVLNREACIAAIESSPDWDEFTIHDPQVREPAAGCAVLTYRWHSWRGDDTYSATMSSVYVRRDGAWRLLIHQQTPR